MFHFIFSNRIAGSELSLVKVYECEPHGVSRGFRKHGNLLGFRIEETAASALPLTFPSGHSATKTPIHFFGKRRSAFSLIEVMLACVLASLLSVVMIQVLRTVLLESRRIADSRQILSETWLLREQLDNDLRNARGCRISSDTMMLGGFLSRDPETGLPTQQMALVTYRIVPKGNRMALERSESSVTNPQTATWTETVWYGVGGMTAFPKGEFLGAQASIFPELTQRGLENMEAGISFQLYDAQGKILVEIL